MWEKRLLLSVFLLGLISRVKSQGDPDENTKLNYVMSMLPVMKNGKTGQVYLLLESEEPLQIKASTIYLDLVTSTFSDKSSNFNDIKDFQEPTGARLAKVTKPPSDSGLVSVEFNLSKDAASGSNFIKLLIESDEMKILLFIDNTFEFVGPSLQSGPNGVSETVSKNFAEVAGWQTVLIGSDGKGTAEFTMPDTISEWKSKMVYLSKEEVVGLTKEAANVITILPVFLEVTVPQFCTRGEKIIVDATAVNYLDKCIKMEITIKGSDFTPSPLSDDGEISVCKGERASKKWSVDCTSIGDRNITVSASTTHISNTRDGANDESETPLEDTVIMTIRVEVEGTKREVPKSFLNILQSQGNKNFFRSGLSTLPRGTPRGTVYTSSEQNNPTYGNDDILQ